MENRLWIGVLAMVFVAVALVGGLAFVPQFTVGSAGLSLTDARCHIDADQTVFSIRIQNDRAESISSLFVGFVNGPQQLSLGGINGLPIPAGQQKLVTFTSAPGNIQPGKYTLTIETADVQARAVFNCV
jgi:hypothetical protein